MCLFFGSSLCMEEAPFYRQFGRAPTILLSIGEMGLNFIILTLRIVARHFICYFRVRHCIRLFGRMWLIFFILSHNYAGCWLVFYWCGLKEVNICFILQ